MLVPNHDLAIGVADHLVPTSAPVAAVTGTGMARAGDVA